MPLTGKVAFDAIAAAAAPYLGASWNYKGTNYTLHQCTSVTGPFYAECKIENIWANYEVVKEGVDALVVRYQCDGSKKVNAFEDVRVLTGGISISDDPTNQEMKALIDWFLESAR
jgi:hypothetical protein